jgi:hypothetical protein
MRIMTEHAIVFHDNLMSAYALFWDHCLVTGTADVVTVCNQEFTML